MARSRCTSKARPLPPHIYHCLAAYFCKTTWLLSALDGETSMSCPETSMSCPSPCHYQQPLLPIMLLGDQCIVTCSCLLSPLMLKYVLKNLMSFIISNKNHFYISKCDFFFIFVVNLNFLLQKAGSCPLCH